MCGITGFIDFNKESSEDILVRMNNCMIHRGPDDHGTYFNSGNEAVIGLAQRRLSILDLSPLGHQPMFFENLVIVFNGEIYNFKEIRKELEAFGYTFKSDSDTEMILKAFHKWGMDCLEKFIGMFAFVLYDTENGQIYIVRDRAGVKPMFYYWQHNIFLFGSELKALVNHPGFIKELDFNAAALFLTYNYIPAPYAIYKNTCKLLPGHYAKLDLKTKSFEIKKYWDVYDSYNQPKLDISEKEAIDHVESLMKSAFNYRMVADVPVGVFLSGGYDSTAVTSVLQATNTNKIKTFTIGFDVPSFNEADEAKKIARFLGTDHTEYYCTPKEAFEIIPQLPDIYDEPFADNSTIPTVLVSRLARKSVTVALSADGGDEIFGGYDKFNRAKAFTEKMPVFLQSLAGNAMSIMEPESIPYFNRQYNFSTRYRKMRKIWKSGNGLTALKTISQFMPEDEVEIFSRMPITWYKTAFDSGNELNGNSDLINKMLAVDYKTFLSDNNLNKMDRATMSVSLEGREPLLDQRIVEFVSQLPSGLKINNGINKYLLKQLVHRYVPKEMMDRPKMPFVAPINVWFQNELKEFFLHYLDKTRLEKQGLFNAEPIILLRDRYLKGNKENVQKLWNLLVFQMWYERWME
jgi:asparagine synthase (glutamine-hydrolysing)